MPLKSTTSTYGLPAKVFHWTIALLIFGLLSVGFFMSGMDFSPEKLQLYGLHKSFGMSVFILGLVRLSWRWMGPVPAHLSSHKLWERALAKLTHFMLYVLMIAMPLSGWLMSSAGEFPVPFFGLFEFPDLIAKDKQLFGVFRETHELMAYAILGILALHMAGAFKHHFIDRDETLQRMTKAKLGFVGAGVILVLAGLLWTSPFAIEWRYEMQGESGAVQEDIAGNNAQPLDLKKVADSNQWIIDQERSAVGFEATQYGKAFSGRFDISAATIVFNPKDLDHAKALVSIDITSINTGSEDRDAQARAVEWFDTSQFPQAVFEAQSFTQTGPNQYVAHANLSIRGVNVPVELPFTLNFEKGEEDITRGYMSGVLTLNRLDFGVGQGEWQSTDAIGSAVKIEIKLEATNKDT